MNAKNILSESTASESTRSRFDLPFINHPKIESGDLNIVAPRADTHYLSVILSILISPVHLVRLWLRFNARRPSRAFYDHRERESYITERASRIARANFNGTKL